MKKILCINGSMRPRGNSACMLRHFEAGAGIHEPFIEQVLPHELDLKYCTGCLRCNLLKTCSQKGDDWEKLSRKILAADVLVFATPIYFHHLPSPIKKMIDRFRSFVHVRITETGLEHTPLEEWNKDFVLLLCMGSSDESEAGPVIELFRFMTNMLGQGNRLHVIKATRLAVNNQLEKTREELESLYEKLELPLYLAERDCIRNRSILAACSGLGETLSL